MSFCRLAPHYDRLERLTANQRLERARATALDFLPRGARVLSVGEGHGRFAAQCVRERPDVGLTCLDASAAMLTRARTKLGGAGDRVNWICEDVEGWIAPVRFDAVVTCFFLDCFSPAQLRRVVAGIVAATEGRAVWVNVDFAIPQRGFWRWRAQAAHFLMYRFFRVAAGLGAERLTSPAPFLREHGFQLERRQEFDRGLIASEVWGRGEPG